MIPIAKPMFTEREINRVIEVLQSGNVAQGDVVREFERNFAKYIGVKHAIACSNGTAALHTALSACSVGVGDEVIVPSFSFISTASSVSMCGATPVFVDVHPSEYGIDVSDVIKKVTNKTRAIIGVHLYGLPCDIHGLIELQKKLNECGNRHIYIIEDSAQAIGSKIGSRKCGSFADIGCFSFYATKNLTTGEGGMITTNNDEIASFARSMINHGQTEKYLHKFIGYNYRMTDVQAAIGVEKLKYIDTLNEKRRYNAKIYNESIEDYSKLLLPLEHSDLYHTYHQYVIQVIDSKINGHNIAKHISREKIINYLNSRGIGTAIHYSLPLHKQPVYANVHGGIKLNVSERLSNSVFSIPVHPLVTEDEVNYIAKSINEVTK